MTTDWLGDIRDREDRKRLRDAIQDVCGVSVTVYPIEADNPFAVGVIKGKIVVSKSVLDDAESRKLLTPVNPESN